MKGVMTIFINPVGFHHFFFLLQRSCFHNCKKVTIYPTVLPVSLPISARAVTSGTNDPKSNLDWKLTKRPIPLYFTVPLQHYCEYDI
jgi:hypothetical protein